MDGSLVINPSRSQLAASDLSLTYAGTATSALMLECTANQVRVAACTSQVRMQPLSSKQLAPLDLSLVYAGTAISALMECTANQACVAARTV